MASRSATLYRIHGLLVQSEIPLEAPTVDDGGEPDYRVVAGEPRECESAPPPGRLLAELQLGELGYWACEDENDPDRWTVRHAGLCETELDRDRKLIVVHPCPAADPGLIPVLVAGSALAHVLAAEGRLGLHASAVEHDGRAVAIAGPSGTGKSTLAAVLCAAGAGLVSDDVLRVDVTPQGAICFPGTRSLRLRPQAASLAADIGAADARETADGRTAVFPHCAGDGPLDLAAIVVPEPSREATRLDVTRLGAKDALVELLRHPRLAGWQTPDPIGRLFELTADVADGVPVFRATVPWGPPFAAGLGRQLLAAVGIDEAGAA